MRAPARSGAGVGVGVGVAVGARARTGVAALLAAGALALPACGGGDGGGGGEVMSPCGFSEPAANQSFARAAAYDLGAERMGCLTAADTAGADFYSFTAPEEPGGGYAQVQVDASGAGKLRAIVYGQAAGAELGRSVAVDAATPLSFLVAVVPGATYRLAVEDDGGFVAPYAYRVTSSFAPVADPYEPNDTLDTAAPATAGAPFTAFLFAGALDGETIAALDDNYRVTMVAGQPITVRMDSMPANVAARLYLFGPDGSELARVSSGHKGEGLALQPLPVAAGGDYVVRVSLWADPPAAVTEGATPPDNFTRAYQLTITQP